MCHGGGPKEAMAKFEAAASGNTIIGRLNIRNVLEEEPEFKKQEAMNWAKKIVG